MFLKKDAQGKFVPLASYSDYWRIEANQLEYISLPVSFISSAEEYYFVLPDFNSNPKGYDDDDKASKQSIGFRITTKTLKDTNIFMSPQKQFTTMPNIVVIMTKDNNELPFEKVTIGEFFTQVEKQFPVWQKTDPRSPENFALAQKNLARLKAKYKNKWNDLAEVQLSETRIVLQDFVNAREGTNDMFDNKAYGKEGMPATFPILKVSKPALALCKTDQPQWLVIRWSNGNAQPAVLIYTCTNQ